MKSKIMKICFNPKAGLLLLLSMAMVAIFAIAIPSVTLAAASDDDVSTKCKGVLDKDLPKCGPVDPNSIKLDVSKCSSQITLNGNGEVVGPCDFIVNFKGLKDAEGYNIHVTMYNEKGEEVHKTASGVREGSTPDPWVTRNSDGTISYRFDGNKLFRETYGDNYSLDKLGTTDNIYDLKTSAGNPYLSLGAKSFSCGKQTFVIKVTPICPCPKGGDLACGKPKRCDTFVDNAKNTDGSYRKFIINSDGTFREVKKTDSDYSKGTDLPSDPEYRQMYIAEKLKDPTLTFAKFATSLEEKEEWCINGTKVYGPKNGDVCKGEACLWKCKSIDGKKIIDCTLPNTVACDGPNGSILTPPEDFWPNLSPEQAREADWYSKNLDWKQNPYMKGWYNLCLVNGKPTNRCAGVVSTVSGASTWTCGSAPNQVKCKSCIKAKCGSAALDKNGKQARYSKNELEALLKSNPKAFCNPGDLVNFWTTYTGLGKHERSWSCVGDKSCGENIANCVITEKYCGDGIKDPGEGCEKDSDCPGLSGKCQDDCTCCPKPKCGETTKTPVYEQDEKGVWRIFNLPTPQCVNSKVVDYSKDSRWREYVDGYGIKGGYIISSPYEKDLDKWDQAHDAHWICKSECSGAVTNCWKYVPRCGDGTLQAGEECEKGIPCANGRECSPNEDSKCKCTPQDECQKDSDCAPEKTSCKDAYTIKVELEKCVQVGAIKKCKKETHDSPCGMDESYCGTDNKTLIKAKHLCELDGNGAKCVAKETSTKCSDGNACNGIEKCKDVTPFGDLLRKADCSDVSAPEVCESLQRDGCTLTPQDSRDFTWDIRNTDYRCEDDPNSDSDDPVTGWKCVKSGEVTYSHKCDKKCGAKCLPELNGPDGRNDDCKLNESAYCSGKKSLVGLENLYGTCLGLDNRDKTPNPDACKCSFTLKYKCQVGNLNCGAVCSEGQTQTCGNGGRGTQTCNPDTCDWGVCEIKTFCGDGYVDAPEEECDKPWQNNPLASQDDWKCEVKKLFTRPDKFGDCTAECKIKLDDWSAQGCSASRCAGAVGCDGNSEGRKVGDKYCQNCALVDCITPDDCTGMHYRCIGDDLYSAKETCEKNKCVPDVNNIPTPENCATTYPAQYDCDGLDLYMTASGKCTTQDPYNPGDSNTTYKQGSCISGDRSLKETCTAKEECENNKAYVYGGVCNATAGKCENTLKTEKYDCNTPFKTSCDGTDKIIQNYKECSLVDTSGVKSAICVDKTRPYKTCKPEFEVCDGDSIKKKGERCEDNGLGEKICKEYDKPVTPFDCTGLNNSYCDTATSWADENWTCGIDPILATPECVIDDIISTACGMNNHSPVSSCGKFPGNLILATPPIAGPYINPYLYKRKGFISQCDDSSGVADKANWCQQCNPLIPGSNCSVAKTCDETCGGDANCNGKEIGQKCGVNDAGACSSGCQCEIPECGIDNGKVITGKELDGTDKEPKLLCASGSTPKDFVLGLNGIWTWDCCIGSNCATGGCSATKLSCGVLDGESYVPKRQSGDYLPREYTINDTGKIYNNELAGDLGFYCKNGTAVIGWGYNNNQSSNNGWEWKWTCQNGSVTTGECHAKALGCGYADAQYFLDNDGELSYAEGKGAHKYNSMPATLCANGFPVHTSVKNEYGSLSWECMTRDSSIKKTCYARSQCPLEDDIETVYYVNKDQTIRQCWTAEEEEYANSTQIEWPNVMFCGKDDASNDCGRGSDIDYYGMNYYGWGERLGSVEIGSFSDGYAKDVQGDHPFNRIIRDDHPGICPTGYKVPTESDWTTLAEAAKYNDDLHKKSGFYAKSGGYWTQTPGEEDLNGVRRNSPIYFDRDSSEYGKFTSAGYIYDQGGETTYDPNSVNSKHQLRCINAGPLQLFAPVKCVGRGCYNPWIIRM